MADPITIQEATDATLSIGNGLEIDADGNLVVDESILPEDTHIDVSDDGTIQAEDIPYLDFDTNLTTAVNSDGSVSVSAETSSGNGNGGGDGEPRYDAYPGDDLQSIIDSLDYIELAPGGYFLTEDLSIPDETTLRGAGERRTIIYAEGPYELVDAGRPATDIVIENLTFDGQNNGRNAIKFGNCRNVTVRDMTVQNCGVRDSSESNAGGIHIRVNRDDDAGNNLVENVTAINCSAVSIDAGGTASQSGPVTVRDCEIREPNTSNRFTHGISVESTVGSVVENCRLVSSKDAQLAINVNATKYATVDGCYVDGWRQGVNNFNARGVSKMTVRNSAFYDVHNEGVLVQPSGDDSLGNVVQNVTIEGAKTAINGKHGGVIDVYDCVIRESNRAIKIKDASVPVTIRGNDVRNGSKPDSRTIHIGGDGGEKADQFSHISDNFVDAYSGHMVVGIVANVAENTILGTWNEAVGDGGSIRASSSGGVYHGNVLGGHLKYADNDIVRDNETNVL